MNEGWNNPPCHQGWKRCWCGKLCGGFGRHFPSRSGGYAKLFPKRLTKGLVIFNPLIPTKPSFIWLQTRDTIKHLWYRDFTGNRASPLAFPSGRLLSGEDGMGTISDVGLSMATVGAVSPSMKNGSRCRDLQLWKESSRIWWLPEDCESTCMGRKPNLPWSKFKLEITVTNLWQFFSRQTRSKRLPSGRLTGFGIRDPEYTITAWWFSQLFTI